ncbi:MAG: hypothetical protein RL518_1750 [Pseudomonadota bacterium]|jgi:hypothetical protein
MTKTLSLLSLCVSLLFISGCSLFQSSSQGSESTQLLEEKALIEAQHAPEAPKQGIEVTWETPSEPVDGFIIRYGSSPNALTKEVTISAADIREVNDPEYGPVYRYLIRDVENAQKLFVSIAAVKGQAVSNFSDTLEAQAEHGKQKP